MDILDILLKPPQPFIGLFFPVTSQTLENCSEEVKSVVSQILNGAANTEPITMTTTMLPVPATPSTSGAKPSPSTSGAKPFFDLVTISAPQGPLPGKTLLLNLFWCLVFSTKTWWLVCSFVASFLGGLSLHLNHLIASCVTNYNRPFGTLPFGLFCSNLDTRDLKTYPRTYSGHFWNMSIFDNSRAVWVLFRKWVVSENRILLGNGWPTPGYSDLVLGGEVPRLNHGPFCFPIQNT